MAANHVKGTLKLWRLYAGMDILWVARGPREAIIYIGSDLVFMIASISTTLLLAARFDGIGQWTQAQIVFMLGYAMLVNALLDTLFGYNMKMISRRIGRGQLDHMLVQPQPLWRSMLTEGFTPFGQPLGLLAAVSLIVWSSTGFERHSTIGWIGILLVNIVASATIILALQLVWGSLAFWAPRAAEEVNSSTNEMVNQLGTLPLDNVPRAVVGGLLSAVPVGFVAWLPSRTLTGVVDAYPEGLATPLAAPAFAALAFLVFRKGLRHYAHVGSQRYSAFGHRR